VTEGLEDSFLEEAHFIVGPPSKINSGGIEVWLGKLICKKVGTPGSVEINWEIAYNLADQGRLLGMIHSHPPGMPCMSQRDRDTMRAWVSCLGIPLICAIECDEEIWAWRFPVNTGEVPRPVDAVRFDAEHRKYIVITGV
jgi:hypothetical protein